MRPAVLGLGMITSCVSSPSQDVASETTGSGRESTPSSPPHDDHPSWCEELGLGGFELDDSAANWSLRGGSGERFELHDYCGDVIFVEIGSEW